MRGDNYRQGYKRLGLVCALAASACITASAHAEPKTLYRETFGYCTGTLGRDAATEANWVGLVGGFPQAKISNLKVVSYGSLDIGGSVNSNPLGLAQGYSFWFKPVYGLTLLTAEFQFDVGLLKSSQALIQYRQRLSGIDPAGQLNKTHLAVLVDDVWYISGEFVRQQQPGVWESAQLAPGALTYGTVPYVAGVGPTKPPVIGAPLPAAGTVRAFGVFLDEVNGRVRIDNFTIKGILPSDGSISNQTQDPDVSLCPASSPDRTGNGGGGPTPPPDEDDDDRTPDRFVPDPIVSPTPTPAPMDIHGKVYQFCAVKEQGTGRAVAVSSKARSAMIKKIGSNTLADLRDRALISLFAQRALPLGSMVNVKRGDYDTKRGVLTVMTRSSTKPVQMKLRGAALRAMQLYLGHAGAPQEVTAPLFIQGDAGIHALHITTQRALCLADLRVMLKTRSAQAKVPVQGIRGGR
ncbi:MAG: hypothetical protein ACK5GN_08405 [Pseudomonadota bacterium]